MCILALSACSEKQLGPDSGTADGPEIRFAVSEQGSGTKALIDAGGLAVAGTQLHVFDILTGFVGSVGTQTSNGTTPITYIDKTIGYLNGAWPFVVEKTENNQTVVEADTPAYYRWTKTGTHKFFGYLTKGPGGATDTFPGKAYWDESTKTLQVGSGNTGSDFLKLLPSAERQFDFLYSDIVCRNAATDTHDPIPLQMQHLFTALSVEVSNQTGAAITGLSVIFANLLSDRKATISYAAASTSSTSAVCVSSTTQDATMSFGNVTSIAANVQAFTPLFTTDAYRLLWPQDNLSTATVTVAFTIPDPNYEEAPDINITKTIALTDIFKTAVTENNQTTYVPLAAMEASHKYLLQITIKIDEIRFAVIVDPLADMNDPDNASGDYNGEHFYFES